VPEVEAWLGGAAQYRQAVLAQSCVAQNGSFLAFGGRHPAAVLAPWQLGRVGVAVSDLFVVRLAAGLHGVSMEGGPSGFHDALDSNLLETCVCVWGGGGLVKVSKKNKQNAHRGKQKKNNNNNKSLSVCLSLLCMLCVVCVLCMRCVLLCVCVVYMLCALCALRVRCVCVACACVVCVWV
jgi:hypothetical protein